MKLFNIGQWVSEKKEEGGSMAIKKSELDRLLVEKWIDDKLQSDYNGRPVSIALSFCPPDELTKEIIHLYRDAGWQIELKTEQLCHNDPIKYYFELS